MAINTTKCIHCDQHYSPKQKENVYNQISKQTMNQMTEYPDLCLECIMHELSSDANSYLIKLNKAVIKFRIFERLHKKILQTKQMLSARYSAADQQCNYIKFFLREESASIARARAKLASNNKQAAKTKRTSKAKQTDLIASLLASLTPEQQALVTKQAAKMK